jgi:hypothetical protein
MRSKARFEKPLRTSDFFYWFLLISISGGSSRYYGSRYQGHGHGQGHLYVGHFDKPQCHARHNSSLESDERDI